MFYIALHFLVIYFSSFFLSISCLLFKLVQKNIIISCRQWSCQVYKVSVGFLGFLKKQMCEFLGNGTWVSRFPGFLVFISFYRFLRFRNQQKPKCRFTDAGSFGSTQCHIPGPQLPYPEALQLYLYLLLCDAPGCYLTELACKQMHTTYYLSTDLTDHPLFSVP